MWRKWGQLTNQPETRKKFWFSLKRSPGLNGPIYMSGPQSYRSGGWFFKNPWSSKMFAKIQGSHSLAFLEVICILQSCIFKWCLRISSFCKTEKVLKSQFDCLVLYLTSECLRVWTSHALILNTLKSLSCNFKSPNILSSQRKMLVFPSCEVLHFDFPFTTSYFFEQL